MINLKDRIGSIPAYANVTNRTYARSYWFLEPLTPDTVNAEGFKTLYDKSLENGGTEGQWCIPSDLILLYLFQLNNTRVWLVKQFKAPKTFNAKIEKLCQTYGIEKSKPYLAKDPKQPT